MTRYRYGRIIFIGRDYRRTAANLGDTILTLQLVARDNDREGPDFSQWVESMNEKELYILEDILFEIRSFEVRSIFNVYLDREYKIEEEDYLYRHERCYIRKVINISKEDVRALSQMSPTRGELEVTHYGRDVCIVLSSYIY